MAEHSEPIASSEMSNEWHYSYDAEFIEEAEDLFIESKDKLFDVSNWATICGITNIRFTLSDHHARELHRKAHTGDYIKVFKEDAGYVFFIENIEYDDYPDENKESFLMRLKHAEVIGKPAENIAGILIERNNTILTAYCMLQENTTCILNKNDWDLLIQNYIKFD